MRSDSTQEITDILRNWRGGNDAALADLIPLVYQELKKTAHTYLARASADETLRTTSLVHELYLDLLDCREVTLSSRPQFFALAGKLMRHILVDHARERAALKRGAEFQQVLLHEALGEAAPPTPIDLPTLLTLHAALERLAKLDDRQSQVVELRFFSGLSNREIAEHLGVGLATVKRDWKVARRWLAREMAGSIATSDSLGPDEEHSSETPETGKMAFPDSRSNP